MKCPNCGEEMKTESVNEEDPGLDICECCGYSYDHKEKIETWVLKRSQLKKKGCRKYESSFGLPTGRF